ncbi:hypothetical protein [Alkaliphilus crotonatoxidans]
MMKYQLINHNFIPKETNKAADAPSPDVKGKIHPVVERTIVESQELQSLRTQLSHSETQLMTMEYELLNSKNIVKDLEEKLRRYEVLKEEINQVDSLNSEIQRLARENETLKDDLKKNQDYIQTLYFILLILAIL